MFENTTDSHSTSEERILCEEDRDQQSQMRLKRKKHSDQNRFLRGMEGHTTPPMLDAQRDISIAPPPEEHHSRTFRDSNASDRNAYIFYESAMREQFQCDNPGMTFRQLLKHTLHMYKNLTPQEKAEWDLRSQQDKAQNNNTIERNSAAFVPASIEIAHQKPKGMLSEIASLETKIGINHSNNLNITERLGHLETAMYGAVSTGALVPRLDTLKESLLGTS